MLPGYAYSMKQLTNGLVPLTDKEIDDMQEGELVICYTSWTKFPYTTRRKSLERPSNKPFGISVIIAYKYDERIWNGIVNQMFG